MIVLGNIICIFGVIFLVIGIAIAIYYAIFAKEYYEALVKYKEIINKADIADINDVYNREFPADFSIKEIREWTKGEKKDDTKDA